MSRVMEPVVQPPAGQGQPPATPPPEKQEPWVLDDANQNRGRWVLDETPLETQEQRAAQPLVGTPAQPGQIQQTPGSQPGQGYQYTLPTGHILRGATPEDVLKQMETALVTMAQQVNQQPAREYVRPDDQRRHEPPAQQRAPFDGKRFYSLLADEKPIEAMHMLMQEYYGVDDPRQIATNADGAWTHAQQMNQRLETADFLSNNLDFPASPQSGKLLSDRLERDGVPITRWNLEVGYQQLLREGALQRVATAQPSDYRANYQQPTAQIVPPTPQSRGAGAPPAPGTQGGEVGDKELSEAEFDMLSTKDQKAYLNKRGFNV